MSKALRIVLLELAEANAMVKKLHHHTVDPEGG